MVFYLHSSQALKILPVSFMRYKLTLNTHIFSLSLSPSLSTCGHIDRTKWCGKGKSFWLLIFRYAPRQSNQPAGTGDFPPKLSSSHYLSHRDEREVAKFVGHNWCLVRGAEMGSTGRFKGGGRGRRSTKTAVEKFRQDSAPASTKSIAARSLSDVRTDGNPVLGNK